MATRLRLLREVSDPYFAKSCRRASNLYFPVTTTLKLCRRFFSTSKCYFGAVPDKNVEVHLDDSVQEQIEHRGTKIRSHPGTIPRIGVDDLPVDLNIALNRVLVQFDLLALRREAAAFQKMLNSRNAPAKGKELRARAQALEKEFLQANKIEMLHSKISDMERIALHNAVKDHVGPTMRSEFYHWTPIEYTPYVCAQYIATRFSEEYTVMKIILADIRRRNPDFHPENAFDFGAGVGSASFAANNIFGNSLKEYLCVDSSASMKETLQQIIDNGTDGEKPLLEKAYLRSFLPGSHDRQYDLVMSAYSLLELPSMSDRLKTIRSLWMKTKRFLVVVEQGNATGYQLIMEARDHLLGSDKAGKNLRKREQLDKILPPGEIFAPCPHRLACPRLKSGANTRRVLCHFPARIKPLSFMGNLQPQKDATRFSYIVFEKTSSSQELNMNPKWPRIVESPIVRGGHAICRLCCGDGNLREIVASKGKHRSYLYPVVKNAQWGARLPVDITDKQLQTNLRTRYDFQDLNAGEPAIENNNQQINEWNAADGEEEPESTDDGDELSQIKEYPDKTG